jgi:hypothetical protein
MGLKHTELAQACTSTTRTQLLRLGAAIVRKTSHVCVLLALARPMKQVFIATARAHIT